MDNTAPHNPIAQALTTGRLVICCGPGGVGKTTAAAALGLHAALAGRRVLVMTIDPAKRLADAMGLHPTVLGSQPTAVDLNLLAPDATPHPHGLYVGRESRL
ncbi:MAG: ArsA-related P-loop ATPase [Myxococcota bacterium]